MGDRDRVFNEWASETYKKACKFANVELKSYDASDVAVRWLLSEHSKEDVQDMEGIIIQSTHVTKIHKRTNELNQFESQLLKSFLSHIVTGHIYGYIGLIFLSC